MIDINYFSDFEAQSQNKKTFPRNYRRGFKIYISCGHTIKIKSQKMLSTRTAVERYDSKDI